MLLYMTMFAMNSGVTEEVILCQLIIYSGLECSHTAFPAAGGRGSGQELHFWYSRQVRKQ